MKKKICQLSAVAALFSTGVVKAEACYDLEEIKNLSFKDVSLIVNLALADRGVEDEEYIDDIGLEVLIERLEKLKVVKGVKELDFMFARVGTQGR